MAHVTKKRVVFLIIGPSILFLCLLLVWLFFTHTDRAASLHVQSPVESIAFAHMTDTLASVSAHGPQLWNTTTRALQQTFNTHEGSLFVAWSPDDRFIAVSGSGNSIDIWDVARGSVIKVLTGHTARVEEVVWDPQGHSFVSASYDHTVRVWETQTWNETRRLTHTAAVKSVAMSPDGQTLVSGDADGVLYFWRVRDGALRITRQGQRGLLSIAYSPDNQFIAIAGGPYVEVRRVSDGAIVYSLRHADMVNSVAFHPHSRLLVSATGNRDTDVGSVDMRVYVWDMHNGHLLTQLDGHTAAITQLSFNTAGTLLASGSWDTTIRFWDVQQIAPGYIAP